MPTRLALLALSLAAGCGAAAPASDAGTSSPGPDAWSPPGSDAGTAACGAGLSAAGEATYYDFADGSGACGYPAIASGEILVAAMNQPMWDGSNVCGMCAHVTGPMGEVTVRVVDLCPECPSGNLDLSPDAFLHISPLAAGRVPITWEEVPCDVAGPLVYHFKDGSNQWWTALQIRNHRHRIASVEAERGGTWTPIERLDYDYFVAASGLGPGPYHLRVTDVHGHVVEDGAVPGGLADADTPSSTQLPACP